MDAAELSVGPISSTQPTKLLIQPITTKTILVHHSQWKFIRYYSFISTSHYHVIRYYFGSHKRRAKF